MKKHIDYDGPVYNWDDLGKVSKDFVRIFLQAYEMYDSVKILIKNLSIKYNNEIKIWDSDRNYFLDPKLQIAFKKINVRSSTMINENPTIPFFEVFLRVDYKDNEISFEIIVRPYYPITYTIPDSFKEFAIHLDHVEIEGVGFRDEQMRLLTKFFVLMANIKNIKDQLKYLLQK